MYKKISVFTKILLLSFVLTACGMPKEKIAQVQEKYMRLSEIHNQVVEAHKSVEDNSLDGELARLQSRASEMGDYNLAQMAEEEIDKLIGDIDSMINEYENYLTQLSGIKGAEEKAVLTPVVITLQNCTDVSFADIRLYERGSSGARVNVLEELELLVPGQYLAGLTVMRDVDNTPWVLALADGNGTEYEVELAVGEYAEENVSLALAFNGEQGKLTAEEAEPEQEQDSDAGTEESGADEEGAAAEPAGEESGSGNETGEETEGNDGESGGQAG